MAAIAGMSVAVASIGVATAANGGSLLLGHHNSATKTTTLKDKHGTPLALIAKLSKPPLTVNSSKLVKHLNAAEVGGLSAAQLRGKGGAAALTFVPNDGFNGSPTKVVILPLQVSNKLVPVAVVSTGKLPAGSYLITATALGVDAACWIDVAPNADRPQVFGLTSNNTVDAGNAAETRTLTLAKPGVIREYCGGASTESTGYGGVVLTAGITAAPVGRVSNGTAATVATPGRKIRVTP